MHLEQNIYHVALLATEKMEMPTEGLFRLNRVLEHFTNQYFVPQGIENIEYTSKCLQQLSGIFSVLAENVHLKYKLM